MPQWRPIEINAKFFSNVKEVALRRASAALENSFSNESGGQTRFPGLSTFADLAGGSPTYLNEWRGDLVAVSASRVYRVDSNGNETDVTGVPLSGGGRCIFDRTPDELLMAAGGPILRLGGDATEILSRDAPDSTHVGYIDGYVIGIEPNSGLFRHCEVDDFRTWSALDTFAANGKPDDLNALAITPYRELLMTGNESVEQFERLTSGTTPFFRRWASGQSVLAPYTLVSSEEGTWAINRRYEFVRLSGQASQANSEDVGRTLENVDNWRDAWSVVMLISGQKFICLQMPFATNVYGTPGITLLYDIRQKRWFSLFGWDEDLGVPQRWPGWSYYKMWGRHFVGGNGKVLELTESTYQNDGVTQRMLGRTAHIDKWGESEVMNIRARVKRGTGSNTADSTIRLRVKKDDKTWTRWIKRSLGKAGDTQNILEFGPVGFANTYQFEWEITDDCDVELVMLEALVNGAEKQL